MARRIATRWKISGLLKAETPIHVGGMGRNVDTDLALAINGRGHYYIPGTSLAGSFRAWMSQSFSTEAPASDTDTDSLQHPENLINQLWGFQHQDIGHASFIIVDDAEIMLDTQNGQRIEIREGVGIDRYTGAASERFKYNRAILPKGVTIPLNITLDCQTHHNPTALWQLLLALEHSDLRIGAAKTRGLGRVRLTHADIQQQDFSTAEGIFDVLINNGQSQSQQQSQKWGEIKQTVKYVRPARLTLDIAWKPRDPVMAKAEGDGISVDILPLVSQVDTGVRFVIPGSSLKGVLRAHAERIVRTVCSLDCAARTPFNQQIQVPLVDILFGSAEKRDKQPKTKKQISQGAIGLLAIDDCYATASMAADSWAAVEEATGMTTETKQALSQALADENPFQKLQPAVHVAIDRWTGGAADKMLYSVLEPIGITWQNIGLYLDVEQLQKYDPTKVKPAIALLLLVLRDFAHRKIPIGYGTNRGMGTVEVIAMTANGSHLSDLGGLTGEQAITPDLSSLGESLLGDLTQAWQHWIDHQTEREAA